MTDFYKTEFNNNNKIFFLSLNARFVNEHKLI